MKIKGSDKVAAATRYFSDRAGLNRALRRERDGFLNLYGGDPDDPTECLFWYEAIGEKPISYVCSDRSVRSSGKWSLCSTADRAKAFGGAMREQKTVIRARVAAYLEAETDERKAKIAEDNPWLPVIVQVRQVRQQVIDGSFTIDRTEQWKSTIE